MYIPNDWYTEFEEYKKNEFYGNEGLYDNFTEEQFETIKDYFRWRSRLRFRELVSNTSLAVKHKKAQELANIIGNVTDWVYDGCVDTGVFGGGYCELGHALRYEHYAFSPSTGRQLIFGSSCASDFFGIEKEKLRKINSVQDETLDEVKFIAFIQNTGKQPEYFKKFYGDLMAVINILRDEMNEAFGKEWNEQMAAFLKVGLPWTKSMVKRYEYVHEYKYKAKLRELKKYEGVLGICNNDQRILDIIKDEEAKNLHIINVIVSSMNNTALNMEDKRKQALLRLLMKFNDTYKNLKKLGLSDFYKFVNSASETIYYTKAKNGDRIATKKEIENMVSELYTQEKVYLPEKYYRMLRLFGWAIFGDEKMYKDTKCTYAEEELEKVICSGKLMAETLDWLNDIDRFKTAILAIKDHLKDREYPDTAVDEISEEVSIKEVINFLYMYEKRNTKDALFATAFDIADKAVTYKKYNVSIKQAYTMRKAYNILTGKVSYKDIDGADEDISNKINVLLKNKDDPALERQEFAFKVIGTVLKYNKISEKQKKVINNAYEAFNGTDAINQNNTIVDEVFIEDNKDTKKVNEEDTESNEDYFMDSKNNDNDYDYKEAYADDRQVFVDSKVSKNGKNRDDWGKSTKSLIEMPSIVAISEALGTGIFEGDSGE